MPRTIFDKKKNKYDRLLRTLLGGMQVSHKTNEEIGCFVGCSAQTICARFRQPGKITLDELRALGKGLDIPIEEIRQSIEY
ncbi:MAG: hypothetical protein RR394_08615 [Oscillospiraceae bacterium]